MQLNARWFNSGWKLSAGSDSSCNARTKLIWIIQFYFPFFIFHFHRDGFIIQIYARHQWIGLEEASPTKCTVGRIRGWVLRAAVIRSRENIIEFIYFNIVRRNISVELLRVLNMHIRRSNDDVIRFRAHHLRCCDGNKLFYLFTLYLFQLLSMVCGGSNSDLDVIQFLGGACAHNRFLKWSFDLHLLMALMKSIASKIEPIWCRCQLRGFS